MTAKERERPLPGILATDSGHRRLRAPLPILLQVRDASDLVPAPPSARCHAAGRPPRPGYRAPPGRSRPACNLQALCGLSTLSDYGCRDIRRRARRAAQPLTRKTGGARGPAAIPSTFPRAEAS